MPSPKPNASSIPMPDDLIVYYTSPLTIRGEKRVVLEDDLPKLYAAWAEQLVERIRAEGAKDVHPYEGDRGDLHERIADAAGNWSGEFWEPQDVADGCAAYVADLLGLERTP